LDPPYDIELVFVQKITFVIRKINKNCCHQSPELHFLTPICTKLSAKASPRPHAGAYSASPDLLAVFRAYGGEGREGQGREGVHPLP